MPASHEEQGGVSQASTPPAACVLALVQTAEEQQIGACLQRSPESWSRRMHFCTSTQFTFELPGDQQTLYIPPACPDQPLPALPAGVQQLPQSSKVL